MADSATVEDRCHQKKLFVGGLGHAATTQTLRSYFRRYGAVVDAVVLRWPDGRSRGFGYVTFAQAPSATAALKDTHKLAGSSVDVQRAVPGTNKVFVGGLPQNASATELREYFEQFGVVSDAVVMMDPVTTRSRGFGFVCFSPGPEGGVALNMVLERYDRHYLRGKWIEVKSAAPPRKLAMDIEASASPISTCGEGASTTACASDDAGADGPAHIAYGLLSAADLPPPSLPRGMGAPPGLHGHLASRPLADHAFVQPGGLSPAARAAAAGLPSLLATAHPRQYVNPRDRVEAKGMPGLQDPMKVPLSGILAAGAGPAGSGLFDAAAGDLRRSLEQLLRLQAAAGDCAAEPQQLAASAMTSWVAPAGRW